MQAWHKAILRRVTSEPQTVGEIVAALAGDDEGAEFWWADVASALMDLEQGERIVRDGLTWKLS